MNGTAISDSICESRSTDCVSQEKMFSFYLVSSMQRVPYPLYNDGFLGLAPAGSSSQLKSYLESLKANNLSEGNHFTTSYQDGLPTVTFGKYVDTEQVIEIEDLTSSNDNFTLWGSKMAEAKLCGQAFNLGRTSVLTYELMPTLNVIGEKTITAYNATS